MSIGKTGTTADVQDGRAAGTGSPEPRGPAPTLHAIFADLHAALPALRLAAMLVSAGVIIAALYFGRGILIPLALAFLLGFLLDPLVVRLRRLRLPRAAAVALVVTVTLLALAAGTMFLATQVRMLSEELPTYQSNILAKFHDLKERINAPGVFDGLLRTMESVQREVEAPAEPKPSPRAADRIQRVQIEDKPESPLMRAVGWLQAAGGPLTDAGIVLVFLVLVLLDRQDMRDRLLRLLGGNLHRTTDAMDEAGRRMSRYLGMQLLVNVSYGVPMAMGLWLIGVPGAALWGAVAAVMRFLPYVGPLISAAFPLALAFAVDPGWSMLVWALALIVVLELASNNLVEPWLYGASTGLSAISLIVSATFWTALWGPVGLVMSTPLTVCLLVIGRHLPRLQFLDVLLGSRPALDAPTRMYQRLLADDVEEAIEIATEHIEAGSVMDFYDAVAVPALRQASTDHESLSTAEHRHRVVSGMDRLIEELREQHPEPAGQGRARVICIGGKWEVDSLSARMIAHACCLAGVAAEHRAAGVPGRDFFARLDIGSATTICLSSFGSAPQPQIRYMCRRLRQRWKDLHIVLALWNAPPELLEEAGYRSLGADEVATTLSEAVSRITHHSGAHVVADYEPAPVPEDDLARVRALRASGVLDDERRRQFDLAAKRAADIFDMPLAMVSMIDEDSQIVAGAGGSSPQIPGLLPGGSVQSLNVPRPLSLCGHVVGNAQTLVVEDIARDPRFANNPLLLERGIRFYAGAPLRDDKGHVYGSLCVLDTEPRTLGQRDVRLLESMADDLMAQLDLPPPAERDPPETVTSIGDEGSSATLGQPVPE